MSEQLGIENLKEALVAIAKIGKEVADSLEDGKITTGETIKLAFQIPNGIKVAKNMKQAVQEIKDLDAEEAREVLLAVAEVLGVEE